MKNPFTAKFFINNRKNLQKLTDAELIVIPAHTTMQRNGDIGFPFRQDSNFWYLTGIDEPDYVLVISKSETYLIAPQLSYVQLAMEAQTDQEMLKKRSGIEQILSARAGWKKLKKQLLATHEAGILLPSSLQVYGIAANPARNALLKRLKRYNPKANFIDIRRELVNMRMVKQPIELQTIQAAIDITCQSLQDIFRPKWFEAYQAEYEIEADVTAGFRRRGATGHAFSPIISSGKSTVDVHHLVNNGKLKKGELLLVDIGAELHYYAADITRMLPIGKTFSVRQKEILRAVADVQQYALSLLKPGANIRENEKAIEAYMGQTLKQLGIIKRITRKTVRHYYPHATSHSLGLDTHDVADYQRELEENMVFTVEPGIYIPEEGVGVRIEDDVRITKTGAEVLTGSLPQKLD
jgi:Xaa-Pro aminopeptidase